jgi:hypothetical protein
VYPERAALELAREIEPGGIDAVHLSLAREPRSVTP